MYQRSYHQHAGTYVREGTRSFHTCRAACGILAHQDQRGRCPGQSHVLHRHGCCKSACCRPSQSYDSASFSSPGTPTAQLLCPPKAPTTMSAMTPHFSSGSSPGLGTVALLEPSAPLALLHVCHVPSLIFLNALLSWSLPPCWMHLHSWAVLSTIHSSHCSGEREAGRHLSPFFPHFWRHASSWSLNCGAVAPDCCCSV